MDTPPVVNIPSFYVHIQIILSSKGENVVQLTKFRYEYLITFSSTYDPPLEEHYRRDLRPEKDFIGP
jgi:hypothetical protein